MSLITLFDLAETLASLAVILLVLTCLRHQFCKTENIVILAAIFSINFFHGVSNVLEYSGITDILDAAGDYLKVLLPLLWWIFFFLILREKHTEKLTISERRFRDLVESTSDLVWEIDHRRCFTYISPNATELVGTPADQLLGKPMVALMSADEAERVNHILDEFWRQRIPFYGLESVFRNGHGRLVTLETNGVPIVNEQNQLVGYRGITRDISVRKQTEQELEAYRGHLEELIGKRTVELQASNTDLKLEINERIRTENQLRASEERYRLLFQASHDALLICRDDKIVDCNQKALEVFHCAEDQLLDRPLLDLAPRERKDDTPAKPLLAGRLRQALAGVPQFFEAVLQRPAGTFFNAEISLNAMEITGDYLVQVIVRDISLRKKMETEYLRTQKLESTGTLAGGIAHDFNNLLTGILGNISLAKAGLAADDPLRQRLKETERAALRAKDLTRQLLTFSKGGQPLLQATSIPELINESARFILSGSAVGFDFEVQPDLMTVSADAGQLSQVIQNLVTNALEAMENSGTITITAANCTLAAKEIAGLAPGPYVRITISDSGSGIPEEALDKIFDPYFSTKETGSGLGLAVAYSILQKHQGTITVQSTVGQGTIFTLYLPATNESPAQKPAEAVVSPRQRQGRILLMDDEETVREVASEMLRYAGYQVESVLDGASAIALYRQRQQEGRPFDLVIMDLTIPGGMGGKEAIGELQQLDPKIRAIVSSGYANDPILADYQAYGFHGMVAKPYVLKELIDSVDALLTRDQ